ncbi:uncharacterized protein LOC135223773 [Macrobrachium nipponense]|uniref:uncharacterized protein LOC135223773 n=1 Tax=Macrobrachium nipponense TaxID=159736 RepID=UPI0030C82963
MVAPYDVGDPVRSFVKVPGSGTNVAAKALVCDLSHVSTVAAIAPIPIQPIQEPQPSPAAAATQDVPTENVKHQKTKVPPEGTLAASLKDEDNKKIVKTRKRLLEDADGKHGVQEPPSKRVREVPRSLSVSQDVKDGSADSVGTNTVGSGSSSSSIGTQTDFVSMEARETSMLREQNKLLQRRLDIFKEVFRSKKRLGQLIRALEVGKPS